MSQRNRFFAMAFYVAACGSLIARTAVTSVFTPPRLSASLTNDNAVVISWHVAPLQWQLLGQEPAGTGDWKPVARNLYHTNADLISVTVPVSNQPVCYKIKREPSYHPQAPSTVAPPLPTTNNLPPPKTK